MAMPRPEPVADLTRDWNVRKEAEFFYRLVMQGKMTIAKAIEDLEMTKEQRDWIVQEQVAPVGLTKLLYQKRQDTLRMFHMMLRGEAT